MKSKPIKQIVAVGFLVVFLLPLVAEGRFISVDPKASKFPGVSPYVYALNNPLKLVDPQGAEPVKALFGSPNMAASVLRSVPAGSEQTLLRCLNNNTNPFLSGGQGVKGRYVGSVGGGAVDMLHFTRAAAEVHNRSQGGGLLTKLALVAGVQIAGVGIEIDQASSDDPNIRHSAFSSEDVGSNALGAAFGAVYDPDKPLWSQVLAFLKASGAISEEEYKSLYSEQYQSMPDTEEEARERYRDENENPYDASNGNAP
ncbi:MAG: hypothetical protein GY832_35010 [Chloroflexi bacterium]|nr:hypothetical protein [Chloroflexota bacterium]